MADKEIEVRIATQEDLKGVEAIENRINKIKQEQIQLRLNAKTEQLDQANQRIEYLKRTIAGLEAVPPHLGIEVDESEVQALKTELARLEHKSAQLELDVEKGELEAIKSEIEALDDDPIKPAVETSAAMASIDQIGQGFDRLKQGASEIGAQLGTVLESAGKQETNRTFLEMSVGAETAATKMDEINKVVQQLPGDDTALQGLLSSAVAKDASLTSDALSNMGSSAADYFAAMSYYGKSATESQQDMTNYLLAGNTAELERSPILASHIDKLKEATTVQERSKALAEALGEEGWANMSQQDTYNNKLETFNGMLERGRYNFGGMFQEGAKSVMDFALKLDDATGGWVGMGLAAASFASPLTDGIMGLGQMANGMKAISELGFISFLKDLEITTKLSAAADWLLSGAQTVLNAVMAMNPIFLVVIALVALAAALIWAYYNVDWFREMVDNAWASIVQFAQILWSTVSSAIQYVADLFNTFTSQIGTNTGDWIQAVLSFILFIPSLPLQLGVALANAIAKTLGFGNNFVQNMMSAGQRAVTNFISHISQIPSRLGTELNNALNKVNEWASTLPQKFWDAGVNAVKNFLSALGIGSPGIMQRTLAWEVSEMGRRVPLLGKSLQTNLTRLGNDAVESFGEPSLGVSFDNLDDMTLQGNTNNPYGTNNITINIDSVDNEDRIQEIVQAVEEALRFDNLTAGRTV